MRERSPRACARRSVTGMHHSPRSRTVRSTLAALAIVATAPIMTACLPTPDVTTMGTPPPPCSAMPMCDVPAPGPLVIDHALFSQTQAVEGFDDQTYLVDDPTALAQLEDLLLTYQVDGDYESADGTAAPGGRTTLLTAVTDSGETITIQITAGGDMSPFDEAIHELVSEWHDSGAFPLADQPEPDAP